MSAVPREEHNDIVSGGGGGNGATENMMALSESKLKLQKRKKKSKKSQVVASARARVSAANDVLNHLEMQYPSVDEDESSDDYSEVSDGLDADIDTYVKIIEDSDHTERKSTYRGNPEFSNEIHSFFSALTESERAKVILKLATETVNEKLESPQRSEANTATRFDNHNENLNPKDSNLIYKNANNNYNGLHSDDAKILHQISYGSIVQLHTLEGNEMDEKVSRELNRYQTNIILASQKKTSGKADQGRRRRRHREADSTDRAHSDEVGLGLDLDCEEFNSTATQLIMRRK
jgi:hypothetical protein